MENCPKKVKQWLFPASQTEIALAALPPLPLWPVLWFLSYRYKKGTPPAGTGTFDAVIAFICTHTPPVTASAVPAACGRPGRGSDSPPGCHSLPRLRFAYPLHKGGFGLAQISKINKNLLYIQKPPKGILGWERVILPAPGPAWGS